MPFPNTIMKKYICILASAALLAACEQKTETTEPAAASPAATTPEATTATTPEATTATTPEATVATTPAETTTTTSPAGTYESPATSPTP